MMTKKNNVKSQSPSKKKVEAKAENGGFNDSSKYTAGNSKAHRKMSGEVTQALQLVHEHKRVLKSDESDLEVSKLYIQEEEDSNSDNENSFVPYLISRRDMKNEQPVRFQIYDTSNTSSLIMEDFNKMVNNCVGTMNSSINNAIDSVNVRCELVQELMNKTVNSVGESLEKNFTNSQDLIKCTAVGDFVEFQHKYFSTNVTAALNLFMDLSYLTQSYYSKASEITSNTISHFKRYT